MVINGTVMKTRSIIFNAKRARGHRVPNTLNGTVTISLPARQLNADRRPREYLTPKEVELLRKAARERGRYRHRDATMILIAYRHGLRPAEVGALRWDQVDLAHGLLHVQRVKNGMPSECAPNRWKRNPRHAPPQARLTGRAARLFDGTSCTDDDGGISQDARTDRGGWIISVPRSPHMLRHACGYKLSNDGQDTRAVQHYLGHKNIQHTVRYTELSPERFKSFWED